MALTPKQRIIELISDLSIGLKNEISEVIEELEKISAELH